MVGVFISYARADIQFANLIKAELDARGADAFIEYQRLQAGNFVKQLGNAIESRENFVIILSPRSVEREWVQAELAWALTTKRNIIPVLMESCSMANVFPLVNLQWVDFTSSSPYGDFDGAIRKLAEVLSLPLDAPKAAQPPPQIIQSLATENDSSFDPTLPLPDETDVPDWLTAIDPGSDVLFSVESNDASEMFALVSETAAEPAEEPPLSHVFGEDDIDDLFASAIETGEHDPEQAVYLLHRVLEIAPDYLGGKARGMVEKLEAPLNKIRGADLLKRAQDARKNGLIEQAIAFGRDAQKLDPSNAEIPTFIARCEIVRVQKAFKEQRWGDAVPFIRTIFEIVPTRDTPVHAELGDLLVKEINSRIPDALTILRQVTQIPALNNTRWYSQLDSRIRYPRFDGGGYNITYTYRNWETAYICAEAADLLVELEQKLQPKNESKTFLRPSYVIQLKIARANAYLEEHEWQAAITLIDDVLKYKDIAIHKHIGEEANAVLAKARQNLTCDPLYQKAQRAVSKGQIKAALLFVRQIQQDCPEFGDLTTLFGDLLVIRREVIDELRASVPYPHPMSHIAFYPKSSSLIAASEGVFDVRSASYTSYTESLSYAQNPSVKKSIPALPNTAIAYSKEYHPKFAYAFRYEEKNSLTVTPRYVIYLNGGTSEVANPSYHCVGHADVITSVSFSPNGKLLISASHDKTVRVWETQTRRQINQFKFNTAVQAVTFAPDGRRFAAAANQEVLIFDVNAKATLGGLVAQKPIDQIAFNYAPVQLEYSRDGSQLFIGGSGIWDMDTLKEALEFEDVPVRYRFAISPDERLIANWVVSDLERGFEIWDIYKGDVIFRAVDSDPAVVDEMAFSPDGTVLAVVRGNILRLWRFLV